MHVQATHVLESFPGGHPKYLDNRLLAFDVLGRSLEHAHEEEDELLQLFVEHHLSRAALGLGPVGLAWGNVGRDLPKLTD